MHTYKTHQVLDINSYTQEPTGGFQIRMHTYKTTWGLSVKYIRARLEPSGGFQIYMLKELGFTSVPPVQKKKVSAFSNVFIPLTSYYHISSSVFSLLIELMISPFVSG